MVYSKLTTTAAVLSLALGANAFWRLPCRDRVVMERIDPLVQPGEIGGHVHTVMGPNTFNANATCEDLVAGHCSSCQVKQDRSAYWTPSLYFHHDNGQFESVPQTGGMLVYYLQRGEDVKAFPPGFQMLAGNPFLRDFGFREIEKSHWIQEDRTEDALRQRAIGFNCLNYNAPAEAALGLRKMPEDMSRCKDGLRAEVFFPSCWDGKRLDAPDHKDHMRYPSLMDDGVCPESHPVRLVSLFFETIWNVDKFSGMPGKYVWSSGDPTGYGYHGDFMNGWEQETLEKAVAECRSPSGEVTECGVFDHYTVEEMQACKVDYLDIEEDTEGPIEKLPGCNPVQAGPVMASKQTCGKDNKPPQVPEKPKEEVPEIEIPESEYPDVPEFVHVDDMYPTVTPSPEPAPTSSTTATPVPTTLAPEAYPEGEDVNPYLVIVTVTSTVTVDAYVTPESVPVPIRKRHGHHKMGKRHGGL